MFTRTKNIQGIRYMRTQIDAWIDQIQHYKHQLTLVRGEKKQAFFDEMVRLRAQIHQMQDQLREAKG